MPIKILLYSIFVLLSCSINAQVTVVSDPNFEQKLLQLGIDSDGQINGQILNSDAQSISYLDISRQSGDPAISSLAGLSAFVNLDTLICIGHKIELINSYDLSKLEYLDCSNNQIRNLNLFNNIQLKHLNCNTNNLSFLGLFNNSKLTHLDCNQNRLWDLTISSNLLLSHLDCSQNYLLSLDVSQHNLLIHLDCNNNKIPSLNLSNVPLLNYLDCSHNLLNTLNTFHLVNLSTFYCHNNLLQTLDLTAYNAPNLLQFDCRSNLANLSICVQNIALANQATTLNFWQKDALAIYTTSCIPTRVQGMVSADYNFNCAQDPLEEGLPYCIISFVGKDTFSYATNKDGIYFAHLDTGNYIVSITTPSPYWQPCLSTQNVYIDTSNTIQNINWNLQPIASCPFLHVDIAAPFLTKNSGGSNYTISYQNLGTTTVHNTFVELELDPHLILLSSEIAIASRTNNLYTFNLGTVPPMSHNAFKVNVAVAINTFTGRTHCSEVHIYPDSLCHINWTGAAIETEATCQIDSIAFVLKNEGSNMQQIKTFSVFEDNIMMRTGGFQLGGNANQVIMQAVEPGRTYRIIAEQPSNYPSLLGDKTSTAVIEGCETRSDGSFNTGYVTQFSNGNSSPFIAIDCQQNTDSPLANQKTAQPVGYDPNYHYISSTTALDYHIRFQNTTSDTIDHVVILDTISPFLDLTSLEIGSSSHPFEWSLLPNNVLKMTFTNLLLPDSSSSPTNFHGFVRYRIAQKANNPIGAIIYNTASLFLDDNVALNSNQTWHTVDSNFVTINVSIDKILVPEIAVSVQPNPFSDFTTITVQGKHYNKLQLTLFDLAGRQIRQINSAQTDQIHLYKNKLSKGLYLYQIIGDGQLINTGKLMVTN